MTGSCAKCPSENLLMLIISLFDNMLFICFTHPEALTETMQYVRLVSYECLANCHLYCMQAACDRTRVSFDFIILENIIGNVWLLINIERCFLGLV